MQIKTGKFTVESKQMHQVKISKKLKVFFPTKSSNFESSLIKHWRVPEEGFLFSNFRTYNELIIYRVNYMALFGYRELINIGGMAWMIWMQWHEGQCRYLLYDMDMEQCSPISVIFIWSFWFGQPSKIKIPLIKKTLKVFHNLLLTAGNKSLKVTDLE